MKIHPTWLVVAFYLGMGAGAYVITTGILWRRSTMVKRTVKRIFKWIACRQYRHSRKLSDHRATNLAVKLTISGSLTPYRAISSQARRHAQ